MYGVFAVHRLRFSFAIGPVGPAEIAPSMPHPLCCVSAGVTDIDQMCMLVTPTSSAMVPPIQSSQSSHRCFVQRTASNPGAYGEFQMKASILVNYAPNA